MVGDERKRFKKRTYATAARQRDRAAVQKFERELRAALIIDLVADERIPGEMPVKWAMKKWCGSLSSTKESPEDAGLVGGVVGSWMNLGLGTGWGRRWRD